MIIAEFCQNHQGNPEILKEMVEKASLAGATFAKIQSFFADDLTPEWSRDYKRLRDLELTWDVHYQFVTWCKEKNLIPMTSIYDAKYLPVLHKCGFQYIKIGSAQALDEELIKTCVATGFKVIISTGGHDLKKVPRFGPLAGVLHCVSQYPCSPFETNLARMLEVKSLWPRTAIGFSSHVDPTHDLWRHPLELALIMGATYLEVHFTILDREKTKDGPVSLDFKQLKQICDFDKLDLEDKLKANPMAGSVYCPQDPHELAIIEKYKSRWKREEACELPS